MAGFRMLDWIYKFPLRKLISTGDLAEIGLTESDMMNWDFSCMC